MFLQTSRYFNLKTVEAEKEDRRSVVAVMLRRLPYVAGTPAVVKGNDRLDVMAQRKYGDPTKFWHIADANTELDANNLVTEQPQAEQVRTINVPEK